MKTLRRAEVLPIALYALLALLVVPVFPHFQSPNELSRWVAAVAIVDFRSLDVSPVLAETGLRNVEDLSVASGRVFSNKAPAAMILALPAYAAARAVTGPGSASTLRSTLTAMRLAASTIPAILAAALVAAVARRQGCDATRCRMAAVILLFATPLFAYGLLYFSHALSAMTLFAVWVLLFVYRTAIREVAAGAMIGAAVLAEYPNAIPAALILACAIPALRLAGTARVIAGGLPFALFLAVYNRVLFGSFFTLSSAHEADPAFRELAGSGIFGVGVPSAAILLRLLADPSKGLLIFSPVLLFALSGLQPARRAMPLAAFVALVAAPLSVILTIAGYPNWHGGWTAGARYLVAALPFIALLAAHARATAAEAFALGASVAAVSVVSLVFPFVPPGYPAPWISFAWPILQDGYVAPNLLHFVARPLAIAVPFAIVALAVMTALPRRHLGFAAAGVVVWLAAGVIADRMEAHRPRATRALVKEAYFGHEGAIRDTLPSGPATARLKAIARALRQSPPPGWPF